MEHLIRERGAAAFQRSKFTVQPWVGAVPTDAETIAFLPVHRLSALIAAKKITSVQLTRIYLERIKRLDPTLLCAVTIMEEQALAEAARADAEMKAGEGEGPAPWNSLGRQGSVFHERRAHNLGLARF